MLRLTPQLGTFSPLRNTSYAYTGNHLPASSRLLRPSAPTIHGTGIFTRCPSTTPFGLALGPDSPSADEPSGGTLRVSGYVILTHIFATQADILTSVSSTTALATASYYHGTLPYQYFSYSTASVYHLAPFIFGARVLDQ